MDVMERLDKRVDMARRSRDHVATSVRTPPAGGCTAESDRCPDARDYRKELRPCCRAHIVQIVQDTLPILHEMGISVWADYGTLLGAVRNPLTTWKDYPWLLQEGRDVVPLPPGIIPHDKDADFGVHVMGSDAFYQLCQARRRLEKMGYRVLVRPQARSMKVYLSPRNHSNVDFFRWIERPDGTMYRLRYIDVDKYKGREFHKSMLFPLSTVPWEGMDLPAPKDPVAFCAFRYGSNWKTPVAANTDGVKR